ncbi:MAG: septum formation protein Maf [Deltaproteobacteria bacterium]|nr:septum formation protein Maf [Deltaproteobacteria bacterium]MBW2069554.1 septum formation protein Maf [Deltaproteobacteria bacterium]
MNLYRNLLPLILASASPRRKELLSSLGISFTVIPSNIDEKNDSVFPPEEFTRQLAIAKALDIFIRNKDVAVIAADTVVCVGNRVFGKPRNEEEASAMLHLLSGNTHRVVTSTCLVTPAVETCPIVYSWQCETFVTFRRLTDDEIAAYVATGEPMDKAGAYGIQGQAAAFVSAIKGSYSNVVGLPLAETVLALLRFGVISVAKSS